MNKNDEMPTKERILNASIDLFAEKGFRDISVREIAKAVGIKASSLYKHYESKEDILESIFTLFKEKMTQTAFGDEELKRYIGGASPEKYLNEAFSLFVRIMWSPLTLKIAKIITLEQQRSRSVRQFFMQELIEKPRQLLRYAFDLMAEGGLIHSADTGVLAEEYSSYIIYLYFEQNFLQEDPDLEEIERKMKQHNAFYARHILKGKEEN